MIVLLRSNDNFLNTFLRKSGWPIYLSLLGLTQFTGFSLMLFGATPPEHYVAGLVMVWIAHLISLHYVFFTSRPVFWWIVILFALSYRILLIQIPPYLANDYLRYLFDGKLLLAGLNPYDIVPIDFPALGGLDIPKPEVKTIYPPLAEGLFAITSWLGGTLTEWRGMNLTADLLCAGILLKILDQLQLPRRWLLAYLWSPLVLIEGVHSAHLEIWTLLWILLFIYAAQSHRLALASTALSAAILTKLVPVLLLPAWLLTFPSYRQRLKHFLFIAILTMTGFLCFFPGHPFGNLLTFFHHIEGYGVLFYGLNLWLTVEQAKWLLTSAGGALVLYLLFIDRRYSQQPIIIVFELFLIVFLFSSMGFPWYLLVILPLAIATRAIYLFCFMATTHLTYYSVQLEEPHTIWLISSAVLVVTAIFKQGEIVFCKKKQT